MKTIIPLNATPASPQWNELLRVLDQEGHGRQATVIVNPACGPGPAKSWPERREWLALMSRIKGTGARLALYVRVRNRDVSGIPGSGRWEYRRRQPADLRADVALWREHFVKPLGDDTALFWLDHHPVSIDSLGWPEVRELYAALDGAPAIANVRAVPSAEFVRRCPARGLCVHDGRGWPPMSTPTVAGKPVAIIAAAQPALRPGAKHAATWLYTTPDDNPAGVITAVSPHLSRILQLAA
jgi:hypothetical protein